MLLKPERVFDRDREWAGLTRFATNTHGGALLGVVSGRRRQGKSFLLEALTSAANGMYFPALEETEAVSLRGLATLCCGTEFRSVARRRTGAMRSACSCRRCGTSPELW